jgi:hypothetical protein
MYRSLDAEKVIATVERLGLRISERFPSSGLGKVCAELLDIAQESRKKVSWIAKPNLVIRILAGTVIVLMIALLAYTLLTLEFNGTNFGLGELAQVLEAAINDLVLIGAAIFFLVSLEGRIKRRRALQVLHELRSIAHVIDMHQLTKDPNRDSSQNTLNSPTSNLSAQELARYLDYCTEMLSLAGKVASLYAQAIEDEVVLNTVNDIEDLTTAMSQKIWQKIMNIKQAMPSQEIIPPSNSPQA